jgi:hypothetical protein
MCSVIRYALRNGTASAGSLGKASDDNYKCLRTQLTLSENVRGFSPSFPPDTQIISSVSVATTSVYVVANLLSATTEYFETIQLFFVIDRIMTQNIMDNKRTGKERC